MNKYSNKRMMVRRNGKFAKPVAADFGIGGSCETCGGIKVRHYDGDPGDPFPHPALFRNRCFTCEPLTEKATASEASKPKQPTIMDLLKINERQG